MLAKCIAMSGCHMLPSSSQKESFRALCTELSKPASVKSIYSCCRHEIFLSICVKSWNGGGSQRRVVNSMLEQVERSWPVQYSVLYGPLLVPQQSVGRSMIVSLSSMNGKTGAQSCSGGGQARCVNMAARVAL